MPKGKKGKPASGSETGSIHWSRRNFAPVLFLQIEDGGDFEDASDLLGICTSFTHKRSIGKSAETHFIFRNDDRDLLDDTRLLVNTTWHYRFGYFDDLSPILEGIVRGVFPNYADKRTVNVELYDSLLNLSVTAKGKNWKRIQSSDIAKAIAKSHGMKCIVDDSHDIPAKAWIQPNDMNDVRFLRDLAALIDFELVTEGSSPPTLIYRKKKYDVPPQGKIVYYDDDTDRAYMKSFNAKVKSLGPVQAAIASTKADKGKGDKTAVDDSSKFAASLDFGRPLGPGALPRMSLVKKDAEVAVRAPSGVNTKALANASRAQMLDKCHEATSEHPLTPSLHCGQIYDIDGVEKQINGKWYITDESHTLTGTTASTSITWKRNAAGTGKAADANRNNKDAGGTKSAGPVVQVSQLGGGNGSKPQLSLIIPPGGNAPPPKQPPAPVNGRK